MIFSACARAEAGGRLAGDRGRRVEVVAGDDLRAEPTSRPWRACRAAPSAPCRLRTSSRRMSSGSEAELLVGLDADLVGPAELVEVVDVGRAEGRLQRAEDVVERDVEALGLHAVDVDVDLRHAGAEGGLDARQARSGRCRRRSSRRRPAGAPRARRRRGPRPASGSRRRRRGRGSPAARTRRPSPPGSRRTCPISLPRIASWLSPGRPVRSSQGVQVT